MRWDVPDQREEGLRGVWEQQSPAAGNGEAQEALCLDSRPVSACVCLCEGAHT